MKRTGVNVGMLLFLPLLSDIAMAQGIDGLISKQIQDQVSRQVSTGISKNLFDNLLIPQLTIRNESGEVKDFSLSHDERYYGLLHRDGSLRIWDSKLGVQRSAIRFDGKRFTKVVTSSSSGNVYAGGGDGRIYVFDILTAKPVTELQGVAGEEVVAMAISKAENKLAAAFADGSIILWELNGSAKVANLNTRHENALKRIFFTNADQSLIVAGEGGFVEKWDWEKGRKSASLPKLDGVDLGFWENDSHDLIYVDGAGNLQWLEQPDNRVRLTKNLNDGNSLSSASVSFAANLIAVSSNTQVKLFNLNDLSPAKQIAVSENISHLHFINQGKQLVGADPKGVLHVWDVTLASELLKLISTESGWTVVDNTGRFDSSEAGMPNVSWTAANKDIPIDNFSANYYEPGVMATQLQRDEFINQPPRKVQEGIVLPPEVSLTVPSSGKVGDEITVSFEIVDAGGGIGEHRLYHNGKIVDKSQLEDSSESEVNGVLHSKISYNVVASAGANKFKVIVANKMDIDSLPQQQTVQVLGAELPPKLHVLAIGIDKYSDDKLNLAYSVADAKAIATTLNKDGKTVFSEVLLHDLLDREATKAGITDKLADISNNSLNDVLVVYLAGHGIAVKGEWYFLPHETHLPISDSYIASVGVSAKQIQALLAKIPVQKVLVMIDSCYSGAGLDALRNLQNSQRHFSRALSKTVGVVVLTATRQDQEAMELSELGHGLFTYVANNGMQGAADLSPRDQKVSAHELVNYSTATIPAFSRKYSEASQEPSAFTIGEDFVLLGR